jgi:hypothetical protein
MRIEERITGREREDFCPIVVDTIKSLQRSLEAVVIETSADSSASKQLKDHMFNQLISDGWRPQFKISKSVSETYPLANYIMDAMHDFSSEKCNHTHRFFVEFCFDNRQAIGSNILKFEVASRAALEADCFPIPVLVCADAGALKFFGWDGSIAGASEYEYALRVIYRDVLSYPPIILALHN